jgi:hypothetical protein
LLSHLATAGEAESVEDFASWYVEKRRHKTGRLPRPGTMQTKLSRLSALNFRDLLGLADSHMALVLPTDYGLQPTPFFSPPCCEHAPGRPPVKLYTPSLHTSRYPPPYQKSATQGK